MKNNKIDKKIIDKAVEVLKAGGLIVYPTETCYGVGVMASNEEAVEKLLKYKKRPEGKAISVAVNGPEMAARYVQINKEAADLYKNFLPGPITVISKSKQNLPAKLHAEDVTLGIRWPDHIVPLSIVEQLGEPITATSANSSGKKTPYTVDDILQNISSKQRNLIDFVIDIGELPHNPPSTVINTTKSDMQILRKGTINLGSRKYEKTIQSTEQMISEGENLMHKYENILLSGALLIMYNAELGAGKTHFTKGIAKGLNVEEIVKSPTYSIISEYDFENINGKGQLIHIDAWRLENIAELEKLHIEEYIKQGNVIAVEWAGATEEYFSRLSDRKDLFLVNVQIDYISEGKRLIKIFEVN
jgi:L-threonylcarbamoyladenylate synthase